MPAPSAPLIGVLAVQGDVREHSAALTTCGAQVVPVRRPSELASVDALVIPGGESTTMDKLVRAFDLLEPIRARIAGGMPVFGSCAGMIMLADRVDGATHDQQTIGGLDVTVRRNAFGRQVDSYEEDLDIDQLPGGPFRAVFIRAPWVEQVGPTVTVLASVTVDGARHPVAVRQGGLVATSFHPEVAGDIRMHEYFVGLVNEHRIAA